MPKVLTVGHLQLHKQHISLQNQKKYKIITKFLPNKDRLYYTTQHPFNGLLSRTTWVSQHQKDKPFWLLIKQEMTGW